MARGSETLGWASDCCRIGHVGGMSDCWGEDGLSSGGIDKSGAVDVYFR